ncbi:unnamed protein product [Eruca vesicaria subsp. sativa]|uniref:RIN4 pathogenic type III effector avirulence factor Avr cleavage site domain-containing protein n=1 Tax=Eruca vesicaria subsp. sativa TaxID=29727 RepID=A0ABC8K0T0_ERUVS|nr:unnamed protein product [Eruca vesicaria subsp. sativa]
MANRPHVPKFGDWSNQEQPFTVVFDNARTKRADLYGSLENSDIQTPPQPAPRIPRPEPPKPAREGTPRAPPPTEIRNKVRAPPADNLYGGGRDGGGLYGGYVGGGGSGNRQTQTPPRPAQAPPRPNPRGGSNGRGGGTTIPPFPGSVGSGENMSYTHIFDKVKEERREGARSYGGTGDNTPSRPINGQHESTSPNSSKVIYIVYSTHNYFDIHIITYHVCLCERVCAGLLLPMVSEGKVNTEDKCTYSWTHLFVFCVLFILSFYFL